MKQFMLDSNENIEFELQLIHNYEKYANKITLLKMNKLKQDDEDYDIVVKLHENLPMILKEKKESLEKDKIMKYIHKTERQNKIIETTKGIRHKTNMKKYKSK